jgi:1-acyl-sn-glycerol-3-phosphate acyltransferase
LAALQSGQAVIIYPEGTTTRDPELWPMRARTGVARLALTAGVPVLPIAQWGAHKIKTPGQRLRLFARPVVHSYVGEALDLSPWAGRELTPAVLREVTDVIMAAITAPLAEIRAEAAPVRAWDPGKKAYPELGDVARSSPEQRPA